MLRRRRMIMRGQPLEESKQTFHNIGSVFWFNRFGRLDVLLRELRTAGRDIEHDIRTVDAIVIANTGDSKLEVDGAAGIQEPDDVGSIIFGRGLAGSGVTKTLYVIERNNQKIISDDPNYFK